MANEVKLNTVNIVIRKSGEEDITIPVLSTLKEDFVIYKNYKNEAAWNKSKIIKRESTSADEFKNKYGGAF